MRSVVAIFLFLFAHTASAECDLRADISSVVFSTPPSGMVATVQIQNVGDSVCHAIPAFILSSTTTNTGYGLNPGAPESLTAFGGATVPFCTGGFCSGIAIPPSAGYTAVWLFRSGAGNLDPMTGCAVVTVSGAGDVDLTNNSDNRCMGAGVVTPDPVITIAKVDTTDPVAIGQPTQYRLVFTLEEPGAGTFTYTINDPIPAALQAMSIASSPFGWGCTLVGQNLTCPTASLAEGLSEVVVNVVAVGPVGLVTNICSFTPNVANSAQIFGECTEDTTIIAGASADINAIKTDVTDPVLAGQPITWTIAVDNAGPSAIAPPELVTITDTLPTGVAFVSATGAGWSCGHAAGTVTCTRSGAPVGSLGTVSIVATAPNVSAPTMLSNLCVLAAGSTADPTPADPQCSEDTTVNPSADINAVKTDVTDPVFAGQPITWTIAVDNAGPSAIAPPEMVTITDTLPAGVAFVSATGAGWSCGHAAGTVTCTRSGAPVGSLGTISIVATAPNVSAPTTLSNLCVLAAGSTADPTPADPQCSEDTTVIPSANLNAVKIDLVDPVDSGQNITYQIAIDNAGPSTIAAPELVTFTDTLPAGVTFVAASGPGWSCAETAGIVTCTRVGAPVGSLGTITIVVTAPAVTDPTSIENLCGVSAATTVDPTPADPDCREDTDITPFFALQSDKTATPDEVDVGEQITWSINLTNLGPSTATGAMVVDTLPTITLFDSVSGTDWDCNETANVVSCEYIGPEVPAASPFPTITIIGTAIAPGLATNVCVATPLIPSGTSYSKGLGCMSTTLVGSRSDLDAVKIDVTDPVQAGQDITWQIGLSNAGPSPVPAAEIVTFVDTLPAGVSFVAASGPGWSCGEAAGTVTCTRLGAPVGSLGTVAIVATAPAVAVPTVITNVCVFAADSTPDPTPGDPLCTEDTMVNPIVDLDAVKTATPSAVSVGEDITWTINVTNLGPSPATVGTVVDTLPGIVSFVSAAGTDWSCANAGGTVTCSYAGAQIGAGNSFPLITIIATANATGNADNSCTAQGQVSDPNGSPNCMTTTLVGSTADINAAKTDVTDPVFAGQDITWLIDLSNAGPSPVPAGDLVTFTDTLPAGVSFVSANGPGWSCGAVGGAVTCTRDGAPVGSLGQIAIVGTAPAVATTTTLSNLCVVAAASTADPTPADPLCAEDTTVNPIVDLDAVKTATPSAVNVGEDIAWTINVTNLGPSPATAGTVIDTLPGIVSFVSAIGTKWSCNNTGGSVSCSYAGPQIDAGNAFPAITIIATATEPGDAVNFCTAEAQVPDPNGSDCMSTSVVSSSSDLIAVKVDLVDPVQSGDQITWAIALSNAGPSPVPTGELVTFTDTLPAGVSFVSATTEGASGAVWTCAEASGVLSCNRDGAPLGSLGQLMMVATAPAVAEPTTLTNVCSIRAAATSDPTPDDPLCTEDTGILPLVDLDAVKTATPSAVSVGEDITWTINVTNLGPSLATTGTVVDTLPNIVEFVSAEGADWTCNNAAGTVTCGYNGPQVDAGNTFPPITIVATANAPGNAVNFCTAEGQVSDPNGSPNCMTTTVVGSVADLNAVKADLIDPVGSGDQITWIIDLANDGPSPVPDAEVVTFTDTLPSAATFVSASGTDWACAPSSGTVICTRNGASIGSLGQITIVATAPAVAEPITLTNVCAIAAATTADPTPDDPSCVEDTSVNPVVDLDAVKTATPSAVNVGEDITWTIDVTNLGPSAATAGTVVDTLPSIVNFVSAVGTDWVCSNVGGTVTCSYAGLQINAGNAFPPITIIATATEPGDAVNFCTAEAQVPDPYGSDCMTTTVVNSVSRLRTTKVDLADPVAVGGVIEYAIAVENMGPSPLPELADVTITDSLPESVTLLNIRPDDPWSCLYDEPTHAITCHRIGRAPVGPIGAIAIEVRADRPGTILNTCVSSAPGATDDAECWEETTVLPKSNALPIPAMGPWPIVALGLLIVGLGGATSRRFTA